MIDAVSVAIAKAIETEIANTKFSQTGFVLERNYADWDLDLAKMDSAELAATEKLRVDITSYTESQEIDLLTRSAVQIRSAVDIAVRRRFGPDYQEEGTGRIIISEIDNLMLFVQEIHILLASMQAPDALFESTTVVEAPVRDHLREMRQFTGVIRTTFLANLGV